LAQSLGDPDVRQYARRANFHDKLCPASSGGGVKMKLTITAAAVLLSGVALVAAPASAQMGSSPEPSPPQAATSSSQGKQQQGIQPKVSSQAVKPLKELQAAVQANNGPGVQAAVAAANAAAKSADDKYMVGALEYKYAAAAKDDAMRAAAIEEMIASGFKGAPIADLYGDLGSTYTRLKQDQRAADAYQHALQLDPNNIDATAGLAEAKVASGQAAEGLTMLQKGIALQSAGGQKAPETWYKRALQIAWKAKLPQALQISREWVAAYPTTDAWTNALAVYQNLVSLDDSQTLDLMRLKRATGSLTPADYFTYADTAVRKGYSGEAKAVLDEGFAGNKVQKSNASFSQLYTLASQKSQGDKAGLPAAPQASSTAHLLLANGDAWYGYGDYAKAADFYRAALAKSDVDANTANLHLGMALVGQGDKAGAAAALNKVTGPEAELAKFWLVENNLKA
jgi:cytochrome c-type biogenesis protein CcmH/NrfG